MVVDVEMAVAPPLLWGLLAVEANKANVKACFL
jgi:hypothetical protein